MEHLQWKNPRLPQLWLFVVQHAEAAALSLGFSLSKLLIRFAAQTYFCCLPPPHLYPPDTTTTTSPLPSAQHRSPPLFFPINLLLPPLSSSLCSLCCKCFGYICFLVGKKLCQPQSTKIVFISCWWSCWSWPMSGEHSSDTESKLAHWLPNWGTNLCWV